MLVLTEAILRNDIPKDVKVYTIPPGAMVTESARRYAELHGIRLEKASFGSMSRTPIDRSSAAPYVDAETGKPYAEKPENMTHLSGNRLVPKSHPRIALRAELDAVQSDIILLQCMCEERRNRELLAALDEVLECVRTVLGCEVKEQAVPAFSMFGMDAETLRRASHNVRESIGIDHPIPDYRMGRVCAELNRLRTRIRKAELAAVAAFENDPDRQDLILTLNRLSSAVYLLFVKEVKRLGR